jgi:hypothetical protein
MAWFGRTIFVLGWLAWPALLHAQTPRVQLPTQVPQTNALAPNNWAPPATYAQPPVQPYANPAAPYASGAPVPNNVYPPSAPSSVPFDPYATNPGAYGQAPPFNPAQPYGGQAPPFNPAQPYGGQAPYYQPGLSGPDSLYPNGMPFNEPSWNMPDMGEFRRLLQRIRVSQSWIGGGDEPRDLGVYDTEVSATFDLPLFGLQDHFLITPGFALHLWDGPDGSTGADLPGQTYDAYLDVGWNPKFTNYFGAELGARVGAYTEFDTFSSDSIRVMGRGLGVLNLSPTLQAKLGVMYIDRNDIKLLPAGGFIWDPSEDRHWEIFFPRPKFAQRLSTVGNHNIWAYLAGEYGGGAWTIVRNTNLGGSFTDSFDYNDFRIMIGAEWIPIAKNGPSGFFEVGYVFKRELVYVSLMPPSLDLPDTFMLRGGFSF